MSQASSAPTPATRWAACTGTAATSDVVSPTPGRTRRRPGGDDLLFPSCSADVDPRRYTLAKVFYEAVGDERAG
jgi:hypothetical protein